MKKKFTRILGVGITIALLASLMAVAIPASALSQPKVSLAAKDGSNPAYVISKENIYTIIFTAGAPVPSGGEIVIVFPADTDVSSVNASDVWVEALAGIGGGPISSANAANVTVTGAYPYAQTMIIELPAGGTLGAGSLVGLTIGNTAANCVLNPTSPGTYTLTVATSEETTPVASSTYTIQGAWVSSNAATNIGTNSATLNGILDSLGGHTTIYVSFVWGTTSGGPYPNETSPQPMTSTGPFSANISGLLPSTTYYFAAKATDNITDYGAELMFNTHFPLPVSVTPNTVSATATYSIVTTMTEDLPESGKVELVFPTGTDIASVTAGSCSFSATSGIGSSPFSGIVATTIETFGTTVLRIVVPDVNAENKIGRGALFQVAVTDVKNPATYGTYTLDMAMLQSDNTTIVAMTSAPYIIVPPTIPPIIAATVDSNPATLNLKSKGKWVTCYIELLEDYEVEDIDLSTVQISYGESGVSAEWGDVQDGVLMVKFDRSDVQDVLQPGDEVEVTVSGELTDGTTFEGTDRIRVIDKGKK